MESKVIVIIYLNTKNAEYLKMEKEYELYLNLEKKIKKIACFKDRFCIIIVYPFMILGIGEQSEQGGTP